VGRPFLAGRGLARAVITVFQVHVAIFGVGMTARMALVVAAVFMLFPAFHGGPFPGSALDQDRGGDFYRSRANGLVRFSLPIVVSGP
jgi:hypothetical protein